MKPILQTNRLQLLPFNPEDLNLLHSTFTNPFVRKYLWDDEIISIEKTQELLQTNEQHFENDNWGLWKILVKEQEAYAGFAGLWSFYDEPQPQLIYGLLPDKIKRGYATEAARAVMAYAFNQLSFAYLVAACDTPHVDSRKVCERLHMKWVTEKEINGLPTAFYRKENEAN